MLQIYNRLTYSYDSSNENKLKMKMSGPRKVILRLLLNARIQNSWKLNFYKTESTTWVEMFHLATMISWRVTFECFFFSQKWHHFQILSQSLSVTSYKSHEPFPIVNSFQLMRIYESEKLLTRRFGSLNL